MVITDCGCADDYILCYRKDCPRRAIIEQAEKRKLQRTMKFIGDITKGVYIKPKDT